MKFLKKIKIAGHEYKIIYPCNSITKDGAVGTASHDFDEIKICEKYKNKRARVNSEIEETLLHEILHCVDRTYNNAMLSENQINRLSQGLYQVLKDNFGLKLLRK